MRKPITKLHKQRKLSNLKKKTVAKKVTKNSLTMESKVKELKEKKKLLKEQVELKREIKKYTKIKKKLTSKSKKSIFKSNLKRRLMMEAIGDNEFEISGNVSYDNDLSQMWFDESIVRGEDYGVKDGGQYNEPYYIYVNYGNVDPNTLDFSRKLNKPFTVYTAYDFLHGVGIEADEFDGLDDMLETYDKSAIIEMADEVIYDPENYYTDYETIEEWLPRGYGLLEGDYEVIETRGYSQGDYAQVIIPVKELSKVWGTAESEVMGQVKTEIDHLFWDAPLYARVTVDGNEFSYMDIVDGADYYDNWEGRVHIPAYDKDKFIEAIINNSSVSNTEKLKQELDDILPTEPVYEGGSFDNTVEDEYDTEDEYYDEDEYE